MITWLKDLLYDPRSFANFIRGGAFLGAELLKIYSPSAKFWWAGVVMQALTLMVKAGEKNA
jgi:hypothetical protein